jgi:hypothetical protein
MGEPFRDAMNVGTPDPMPSTAVGGGQSTHNDRQRTGFIGHSETSIVAGAARRRPKARQWS